MVETVARVAPVPTEKADDVRVGALEDDGGCGEALSGNDSASPFRGDEGAGSGALEDGVRGPR